MQTRRARKKTTTDGDGRTEQRTWQFKGHTAPTGNSKATRADSKAKKTTACNSRPRPPNATYLAKEGAWLGRPASRLNGLSQAPSPPSIYYMHHRGNTSCKIPYTRASPSDPAPLLTCPRRAAHKSSVLGQIKPCCRCTKKKPAAAQPRNSPQRLQLTTAALEVGYALSTIPYPCRCGPRPVHRPGTGSLHPHRPPRAARKGKETKLRPNKTRPPQRPGRVPPAFCSLGLHTSLYTATRDEAQPR